MAVPEETKTSTVVLGVLALVLMAVLAVGFETLSAAVAFEVAVAMFVSLTGETTCW